MDSDLPSGAPQAPSPRGPLVGKSVRVRRANLEPDYFTPLHRARIGETGRVHAIVPSVPKDDPLVKVGFDEGTQIVFFRLSDLEVNDEPAEHPKRHGVRGSHLPR